MTDQPKGELIRPVWQRIGIGLVEVFVIAPMQALEEGFIWGGAIAVGLFLNGYTLLWLLEHFGIV